MDMDSRQQQPPPPATAAPPNNNYVAASQQPVGGSDNVNYFPQSQQPYGQAQQQQQQQQPPPPQQMFPPAQAQPAYQKHQPLIDQSGPLSPDFSNNNDPQAPTVGFSTSQYDTSQSAAFSSEAPYASLARTTRTINMRYQLFLDRISPHWKARWTFSLLALLVFMARVILAQGWYVICYGLAIYYLNLLIGFISPKVDPGMGLNGDDDDELNDAMLPTHANDEFRPFIRRLPEFKFWISGTKATLISLFLSLFDIFDVPVFWPILLIYFVILFACTMRQQIQHMIRYSYVPWDSGKKKYTGRASASSADNLYPQTV